MEKGIYRLKFCQGYPRLDKSIGLVPGALRMYLLVTQLKREREYDVGELYRISSISMSLYMHKWLMHGVR